MKIRVSDFNINVFGWGNRAFSHKIYLKSDRSQNSAPFILPRLLLHDAVNVIWASDNRVSLSNDEMQRRPGYKIDGNRWQLSGDFGKLYSRVLETMPVQWE